jgi:hypothetical protein
MNSPDTTKSTINLYYVGMSQVMKRQQSQDVNQIKQDSANLFKISTTMRGSICQ